MRAFLPNLGEAQTVEKGDDLTRFQRGQRAHLRDPDGLDRHELGLEFRLPILEEHAEFLQVRLQFIERLALAVCTRPAGDMADEQAGVRVAFDDHVEGSHDARIARRPPPAQRVAGTVNDGLALSGQS